MKEQFGVRLKTAKKKNNFIQIVIVALFGLSACILFNYDYRYSLYFLILISLIIIRLFIFRRDENGMHDYICGIESLNDGFIMSLSLGNEKNRYWNLIKYSEIREFDIKEDGRIVLKYRNDCEKNNVIELYLMDYKKISIFQELIMCYSQVSKHDSFHIKK